MIQSSILVIGIDANFCYLMQRYIHKCAFRSLQVSPGLQTSAVIRKEKPAAIILEITSQESEGWKILDVIRADPETKDIPAIICSWQDEGRNWVTGKGYAFLRMPILYEEFQQALVDIGVCSKA